MLTTNLICCIRKGNKAVLRFNLNDYTTKAEVLAAVDRLQYLGQNTNTTGGLKVARMEVFGNNSDRRQNVERIIVLITDGVPTYDADQLPDEVVAIKQRSIRIVGLGVTNKVCLFCNFLRYKTNKFAFHLGIKIDDFYAQLCRYGQTYLAHLCHVMRHEAFV